MSDSPSQPRAKRQRIDKSGRFAALERLKNLKDSGAKHKYELNKEIDNVYDTVDEKEYAKRVMSRAADNWIEDDYDGRYFDDGREIFDDDEYADEEENSSRKNSKKRNRDTEKKAKGKGSIKNLFSNAVPKKKEAPIKLADDDILADILGEIDDSKQANSSETRTATVSAISRESQDSHKKQMNEAALVKEYMQSFSKNIKKKEEPQKEGNSSDDEMIDRLLKPTKKVVKKVLIYEESVEEIKNDKLARKNEEVKNQVDIKKPDSEEKLEVEKIDNEIENESNFNEMDFSILDDAENQFEVDKSQIVKAPRIKETKSCEKSSENLLNGWESVCGVEVDEDDELLNCTFDLTELKDEVEMKIWFWDAWEDPIKHPGQIFLFGKMPLEGKTKEYKSVAIHIENVERRIYLLPRKFSLDPTTNEQTEQEVTLAEVYQEFNESIAVELQLKKFRTKKVVKNFAFSVPNVNVPQSCEYIEVRYDGRKPPPNNKKVYKNIAHIFGVNTNALETFLLECKIKGPCWLTVKNFSINERPLSWCKLELCCSGGASVSVAEEKTQNPPPLVVAELNVRTALNPKTTKNEVVMVACLIHNRFSIDKPPPNPAFNRHFCGFTRPIVQNWPFDIMQKISSYKGTKITKCDSERALLSWFLATYQNIDPDLIITYDANDCQLDVICDRLSALKIPMWSRIGRLRMTNVSAKRFKNFFVGRMVCDVKQSAEELIKSRSYDLDTICTNVLKIKEGERIDVSNDDLYRMYETSEGILKLITLTMQDASYILRLMCELNVLPLALQITNICGNLMSRTLQGGRSERNEFLLLHAFNEKDYIVPDKRVREAVNWDQGEVTIAPATRKKAAYSGGLVLEPIKGFYDKYILLMDFNSLYPSIIQEYNICFTTIDEPIDKNAEIPLPDSTFEQGVLPRQIRRLVESRREVKKLMANPDLEPDLKMQYNIRQMALKLTANSMYGCLGFSYSRFHAQHLASLVTQKGREILMNTKGLVHKLNFDVIYGDTDSIMVNTNCIDYDQVYKIGSSIKQVVNKIYRHIELEIDGVFKYLLLLKKKKYAAIIISKNKKNELVYTQEHKGLDIVRRDWSQISVMAGKVILDEILSDNQMDERIENIHNHLEKFKTNILEGSVPLPLLMITKQLTKAPKEYANTTTLPHVQVALRMNATKNRRFKKGDMVSYIICEDGTENVPMQRAYHLDELKSNEALKIDTHYYLAQQIHPVVSRLCEPIEGTDASRIAKFLGLDPAKFKVAAQKIQRERDDDALGESIVKSNLQKYRYCEKFQFKCVSCKHTNLVASAFKRVEANLIPALAKCSNSHCNLPPYQYVTGIRNEMILSLRNFIRRFYENWMICDDTTCNNNTRIFPHITMNSRPVCIACKQGCLVRQYSESDLYNQLCYFQYMFDLKKHEQKQIKVTPEIEDAYKLLKETVDRFLANSGYCVVKLSNIFAQLHPNTLKNRIKDENILY